DQGVGVPGRMSVVGFDGHEEVVARYDLSTVRQSPLQVGLVGGRMMGRLLAGDDPADCRTVLPVEFVERGTTAPAPR
ncbi:MAG: substrate-binding domain-containing protein, partial [Armatimonadetes bacterium]|nr:substrate-binding domain-containing protein [Armatimonadota bacterium]